jgi:hypothetical protein
MMILDKTIIREMSSEELRRAKVFFETIRSQEKISINYNYRITSAPMNEATMHDRQLAARRIGLIIEEQTVRQIWVYYGDT